MDLQLTKFIKGIFIVLFTLLTLPFLSDFFSEEIIEKVDKQVEIKNSVLNGFNNGKISWKIHSDYIYSTKSKYLFKAKEINAGYIYDNKGQLVIDNISGKDIHINTKSNTVSIHDGVFARLRNRTEPSSNGLLADDSVDIKNWVHITSDELRYFSESKRTYLYENVKIIQNNATVMPNEGVEIDNNENIAYIDTGFKMESDEFEVSGNQMTIYIDEDYSHMFGNLIFKRKVTDENLEDKDQREQYLLSKPTILKGDKATYSENKEYHILEIEGNVRITQNGKLLKSEKAYYDEEKSYFELKGNVSMEFETMDWMIDDATKNNISSDEISDSLKKHTKILSDKAIFEGDNKTATFIGNVFVEQSDKHIRCNKLVYEDKNTLVNCFGNVKVVKENQDTLYCEHLEVNIKTEEFIAKDGVYTEFNINKDK